MTRIERNDKGARSGRRSGHRERGGLLSHDERLIDVGSSLYIALIVERVDCRFQLISFIGSICLILGHGRQGRPLVLLDFEAAPFAIFGKVDFRKLLLTVACLDLRLHLEKTIVAGIVHLKREERGCPRTCLRFGSLHLSRRGFVQQRSGADGGTLVVDRYSDFLFGAHNGRGLVKIDEAERGLFDHLGCSKFEGTDAIGPVNDAIIVDASGNGPHFTVIDKRRRIRGFGAARGSREQRQGRERENEGEREKYSAI